MPALLSSPPTPGSCPDAIAVAPSPAGAAGPDRRDGGDLPDRHRHRLRRCSGVFLRGGHPGRLARAGRPWADHAGPCLHRADRSELLPDPLRHLPYRPGQFGDRHAGDRHHHLSGPEHGSGQGGGAGGPGTIAAGRARVNRRRADHLHRARGEPDAGGHRQQCRGLPALAGAGPAERGQGTADRGPHPGRCAPRRRRDRAHPRPDPGCRAGASRLRSEPGSGRNAGTVTQRAGSAWRGGGVAAGCRPATGAGRPRTGTAGDRQPDPQCGGRDGSGACR
ncbi:hypothetical protein G6F22_006740 [Rhizopus arrhizus]|nr:hypothetical protein G6F22_006740 [Rhizopus arrhizus]